MLSLFRFIWRLIARRSIALVIACAAACFVILALHDDLAGDLIGIAVYLGLRTVRHLATLLAFIAIVAAVCVVASA